MMNKPDWKNLKPDIKNCVNFNQQKFDNFFNNQLDFLCAIGLENVVYQYIKKQVKRYNFPYDEIKQFINFDNSIIKHARECYNNAENIKSIKKFIEEPTLENIKKLNSSWISDNLQLLKSENELSEDERNLINGDTMDVLFDLIIEEKGTLAKLSSIVQNFQLLPDVVYKNVFHAKVETGVLIDQANDPLSILDTPATLKAESESLYKIQFCEPRKMLLQHGNAMIFIGLKTGRIFISRNHEMVDAQANHHYKLQDYILTDNHDAINTMHFDPYHTTTRSTAHVNYASNRQDKLTLDELATATGQPKKLLATYFTSRAQGAHTHIFFPQINEKLVNENENIAIAVPDMARYTRDIFLATAHAQNEKIDPLFLQLLDIDQQSIKYNQDDTIDYTIQTQNCRIDYTIPEKILNSDLGMHYTMFSDGSLTYDPTSFIKYLLKVLEGKTGTAVNKAKEDIDALKKFLKNSSQGAKYMSFLISKSSDGNKSAFETDSRILQNFNSTVIYLGNQSDGNASQETKPIETTFIVALIFKIFNGVHTALSQQEQTQIMSVLQGKIPSDENTKSEEDVEQNGMGC